MLNYSNTKVTLELRDVLASLDEKGQPFKLWDFDYPSYYQGDAKTAFEQKVIDHFLFQQIGSETVARFKHNFKTRIREIMPYYLQMYKSVEIMDAIDDPFGNVNTTETFEQTTGGTSRGSSTSEESANKTDNRTGTEHDFHKMSNTPHGSLDTEIEDGLNHFVTEAAADDKSQSENVTSTGKVNSSDSNETTTTGNVSYTLTRVGNQGVNTYAHDMIEFRQSFINVDMMIIDDLRDLFLLVY